MTVRRHILALVALAGALVAPGLSSAGWLNRAPGVASGWFVDGRADVPVLLPAGVTQLIQADNSNVWVSVTNGQVVVTTLSNWVVYAVITNVTPMYPNAVVIASVNSSWQVGDLVLGPPSIEYWSGGPDWFTWTTPQGHVVLAGPVTSSPGSGWLFDANHRDYGNALRRVDAGSWDNPVGDYVRDDSEVVLGVLDISTVTNIVPTVTNCFVTANILFSGISTTRQVWATLGDLPPLATYPVITLPIGGGWSDFILKASTDNFVTVCWKVESAGGTPNHVPDPDAKVFYTDDYAADSRQWLPDPGGTSILSLLANANSVVAYVVVSPSHNCTVPWQTWMYEGNPNLVWSYCRVNGTGLEMNVDGTAVRWQVPASVVWKTKQVQP